MFSRNKWNSSLLRTREISPIESLSIYLFYFTIITVFTICILGRFVEFIILILINNNYLILLSLPPAIFVISLFAFVVYANAAVHRRNTKFNCMLYILHDKLLLLCPFSLTIRCILYKQSNFAAYWTATTHRSIAFFSIFATWSDREKKGAKRSVRYICTFIIFRIWSMELECCALMYICTTTSTILNITTYMRFVNRLNIEFQYLVAVDKRIREYVLPVLIAPLASVNAVIFARCDH